MRRGAAHKTAAQTGSNHVVSSWGQPDEEEDAPFQTDDTYHGSERPRPPPLGDERKLPSTASYNTAAYQLFSKLGGSTSDSFDQLLMQLSHVHHREVQKALGAYSQKADATSYEDSDAMRPSRIDIDTFVPEGYCTNGTINQKDGTAQSKSNEFSSRLEAAMTMLSAQMHDLSLEVSEARGASSRNLFSAPRHDNDVHVPRFDPRIYEAQATPGGGEVDPLNAALDKARDSKGSAHVDLDDPKMDKVFKSIFSATSDTTVKTRVYNVEDWYYDEGLGQKIARNETFKSAVLLVISLNAVVIGIEAEQAPENENDWPFILCNHFFCAFFGFEILARFFAFRKKVNCLRDAWFRFDAVLVIMAVLETWMLPIFTTGVDLPFAPLRLLRLLRLTRMVRIMQFVPELVTLIKGMFHASRATFSTLMLIVLMVYIFAIILRFLLDGQDNPEPYQEYRDFETLPRCMWTLFADLTLLESPAYLLTSFMFHGTINSTIACFILIIFMVLSTMMIMNMLIGCMCEVVTAVAKDERDDFAVKALKESILSNLTECDVNHDGVISKEELALAMSHPRSVKVLQRLKIDKLFLLELQSMLFSTHGAKVPIQGVMELMLLCRGDLPTTVQHMASAQAFLSTMVAGLERRLISRFDALHEAVSRNSNFQLITQL